MRFVKLLCLIAAVFLLASCSTGAAEIKQSTHQEAMETYARAMEQGDYDNMAAIYPTKTANEEEYNTAKENWSQIRGKATYKYLGTFKSDGRPCYILEFTASQMPKDENFQFQDGNKDFQFVLFEQNNEGKWVIYGMGTGISYDENSFIDE